jgi:hypothetical protein
MGTRVATSGLIGTRIGASTTSCFTLATGIEKSARTATSSSIKKRSVARSN